MQAKQNYLTGVSHYSPLGTQTIAYTYDKADKVASYSDGTNKSTYNSVATVDENGVTVISYVNGSVSFLFIAFALGLANLPDDVVVQNPTYGPVPSPVPN